MQNTQYKTTKKTSLTTIGLAVKTWRNITLCILFHHGFRLLVNIQHDRKRTICHCKIVEKKQFHAMLGEESIECSKLCCLVHLKIHFASQKLLAPFVFSFSFQLSFLIRYAGLNFLPLIKVINY